MDIRRLRTVTILGPILFLIILEVIGIILLRPALGVNSLLRLLIIFAVLTAAVVPFSFWVFAIIERQQHDLVQSHAELQERVSELREAHQVAAERNRQLDAVAIENARLYEDARNARDRLQAWTEQLEAIVAERTREIERYSRDMTTRVFQAQEDERLRIARELHDDTAQSLSTLLITLDLLEPSVPTDDREARQGFERIRSIAKRTLDEVRALSHDLRPTILDDFGLEAALQWYADEYTLTFGIPVAVSIEPRAHPALLPEVELALFRIAQEALTNSGKYAAAARVDVVLSYPNQSVRLVIEDDGRGFDPAAARNPSRQGGLGLFGMRERAELLGATLTIESSPGKGTKVTAVVPLGHDAAAAGNGAFAC
jgi:signal transduction histidine kinase